MNTFVRNLLLTLPLLMAFNRGSAQGTAFTYQGQLTENGSAATGTNYGLSFSLYTAPTNGTSLGTVSVSPVSISNGLFTVSLDFGEAFDGTPRWLQISVQQNGGALTMLSPLQPLTATPYAIVANSASNLLGTIPLADLPGSLITNNETGVSVSGIFTGDGAGLTNVPASWQTVSGTNQNAADNESYLLTNNVETTLTLPSSATVGDVVTVSGVGSNGWQVIAGTDQSIVGEVAPSGVFWTELAPGLFWSGIASSSDGSRLVAVVDNGSIYTSTNFGTNWTEQLAAEGFWGCVASSPDGSILAAAVYDDMFVSTNFGLTWSDDLKGLGLAQDWVSITISDSGRLAAVTEGTGIYTSADSGVHWMQQTNGAPAKNYWFCNASSSDGSHLVAAAVNGGIYTSTNFGTNWAEQTNGASTDGSWDAIASSSDGSHLAAVLGSAGIYTSTDFGTNWTEQTTTPSAAYGASLVSSGDGSHLAVAVYDDWIYTSTNFGTNWTRQTNGIPPGDIWLSLASSSDGTRLAAVDGNAVYTSEPTLLPFTGMAGDTAQFQYIGGDLWQPLTTPARQVSGAVSLSQLPSAVLTNDASNATLNNVTITGNGSGLNNLNASALTSGTIADVELSTNVALLNQNDSFGGNISVAGVLSGNGGGLTNLQAATLTGAVPSGSLTSVPAANLTGSVPSGSLTSVPAANLTGTIADVRLSTNVALRANGNTFSGTQILNGNLAINTSLIVGGEFMINTNTCLDAHAIYLRGGDEGVVDLNHGLGYIGSGVTNFGGSSLQSVDGPALWGHGGGVLGTRNGTVDYAAITWSQTGVSVNGTFNNNSDRNVKQNFTSVTPSQILDKVSQLPLSQWSYKADASTRHIGPMAQDFYSAFNVGTDDKHIAPIDEGGVALAAIQGLNQKLGDQLKAQASQIAAQMKEKDTEIEQLKLDIAGLKATVLGLTRSKSTVKQ